MNLDHVNVYVTDLENMSQFYQDILKLKPGIAPLSLARPGNGSTMSQGTLLSICRPPQPVLEHHASISIILPSAQTT